MSDRYVVGVDLGGTNVRASLFSEDGREVGPKFSNPSYAQRGTEAILDAIAGTICQAADAAPHAPSAVGMAIPGHIDAQAGRVVWAPNFGEEIDGIFRNWEDVDLRGPLESRVKIPIHMGNDANLAALG